MMRIFASSERGLSFSLEETKRKTNGKISNDDIIYNRRVSKKLTTKNYKIKKE